MKRIEEGDVIGIVEDAIKVIEDGIGILKNCNSLFCYGPTYKKCEKENP